MRAAEIMELEPNRETLDPCNSLTDEALLTPDRMEENDARRAQG